MKDIVIKNGLIIDNKTQYINDIHIHNGKIANINNNINITNAKIIDATNKYIFPGAIDPHVHFSLQTDSGNSSDNFFTGSKAAIAGGTTCFIDFVTPHRKESLIDALEKRKQEAKKSLIDYGLHMSITGWNNDSSNEIKKCIENEGINSFKTYLAYKNSIGINDNELIKVLDTVSNYDAIVTAHCEHGDIIEKLRYDYIKQSKTDVKYHAFSRPQQTESEAVNRIIMLAMLTNCKLYIVHVSTEESINFIQKAQQNGQYVLAETCPQYLLFDDSVYNNDFYEAAKYVLSPPLRKKQDIKSLWNALKNNTIQTIATDHCPFNLIGQKDKGKNDFTKIPNGVGGVEHRLELLYTFGVLQNKININQFVDIISTNAAKIFGLGNRKGEIKKNYDADIVIWNPVKEKKISVKNHFQNCDNNIYEGIKVKGTVETVITNGVIAFENNKFTDNELKGRYIYRK